MNGSSRSKTRHGSRFGRGESSAGGCHGFIPPRSGTVQSCFSSLQCAPSGHTGGGLGEGSALLGGKGSIARTVTGAEPASPGAAHERDRLAIAAPQAQETRIERLRPRGPRAVG